MKKKTTQSMLSLLLRGLSFFKLAKEIKLLMKYEAKIAWENIAYVATLLFVAVFLVILSWVTLLSMVFFALTYAHCGPYLAFFIISLLNGAFAAISCIYLSRHS